MTALLLPALDVTKLAARMVASPLGMAQRVPLVALLSGIAAREEKTPLWGNMKRFLSILALTTNPIFSS